MTGTLRSPCVSISFLLTAKCSRASSLIHFGKSRVFQIHVRLTSEHFALSMSKFCMDILCMALLTNSFKTENVKF